MLLERRILLHIRQTDLFSPSPVAYAISNTFMGVVEGLRL